MIFLYLPPRLHLSTALLITLPRFRHGFSLGVHTFLFLTSLCTVAPVAMEDSDHEVHSSSEEQYSRPASPNPGRDHDAEQVPVTPQNCSAFDLTPLLVTILDCFGQSHQRI